MICISLLLVLAGEKALLDGGLAASNCPSGNVF